MWLPVLHTYQRNETAGNISALGKYANIRMVTGTSGTTVRGGSSGVWPEPYGGVNGSNAWMTAAQAAPEGCVEAGSCPVFTVGASCWYFAQGLADLGVTIPIGIVDTAIGGQHIEEFMINHTIAACTDTAANVTGHDFGPWGNAQVFGSQVIPFVDMTIKGFVWYREWEGGERGVTRTSLCHRTCSLLSAARLLRGREQHGLYEGQQRRGRRLQLPHA
jgi:hypothetical protein